ncbi:DegT/DnrJ/EryC1/StrS family aminotransferase [Rhodospirillum rubrum]|uniref:DegT/DnrJ/EryC1/StrS aminotransferase n=1 Tax=Rhodospirillum rubrum (strain ATCC 11170 / ATH 1.1.1 / DSM 467 / LMG 4362 / NCIMB 8255 / S1) TaxID=269796 RepID=Q2RQQ2_RHORT|nr:DegT/DnrJ/EryC1/StrS family aminotransferase [Rhodospirillum rubrum]ABC23543.1 DegT/DnrJ/EryC1/StrS aminotransferase [Rhodospirillum rubrum ATCC 11170]AEO49282.1 DegT/DnrJ/EryC1/StrS aminotransferase [Rhodospirillum rubrum F11]MBK5955217.1 DegT/DnrJ/EryC1/StrS family aminotransferase [Rhodospirillum rubrum]QXG79510.1 DegT/DnrJ/EryC1/StrS family aminotransferase [Rhodospirillum rubrum]HAP98480.1 DegT/DnrJ/EryC1/StrS family aminotransferase [Rhodospirillum rubrum]
MGISEFKPLSPPAVVDAPIAFGRPSLGAAEIEAVAKVLASGWIGMGEQTLAFERDLGARIGCPHTVLLNSCTSALFLSLHMHAIGAGDEVVLPSLNWFSAANASLWLGARPAFCDVDEETLCVTPETVAAALTPRTRAVVVVHMGGHPVDIEGIAAILPPGVLLIEDAAHAMGGAYLDGRPVGSAGNPTCYSFYANKNLSTGEGGLLAAPTAEMADRARRLRLHGLGADSWKRYIDPRASIGLTPSEVGFKMNYTDLQAAIGRVQLSRLDAMQARRREICARYRQRLGGAGLALGFQAMIEDPRHARHLLVVRLPVGEGHARRDDVFLGLKKQGIGVAIHYTPLHHMAVYRDYAARPLPVTDRLSDSILSLPLSACLSDEDVERVCERLIDAVAPS